MCKKFFHPASADNLKRVWIAQKKSEVEKKAQDDLRRQYDREQELYQNKALLSKESKERLELNFMYEPPPGVKKIGEKDAEDEDGKEPEYKFEWQRTWGHAPKESYLQKGDDFNEQPFGIQVCQAKCIKCGKYGHMNTDKRCALYGKSLDHDAPIQNVDQARLLNEMRADGLAMRYSTWDIDKEAGSSKAAAGGGSHSLVEEERGVDRVEMLKNMSKEEKKKLLKKLKKMEKKDKKKSKKDKKQGRSKSESEEEEWEERGATVQHDKKSPKNEDKKSVKKIESKRDDERSRNRSRSTERRRRDRSDSRGDAQKDRRRDRSVSREERKERRRDRSDSREDRRDRRNDRSDSREGRKRERSRSSGGRKERRRSREQRRERPVSREGRGRRS